MVTTLEIMKDKEILAIKNQIQDLVKRAENFLVASDETLTDATGVVGWIADKIKLVEKKRKIFVDPYNQRVKEINTYAKEFTNPLSEADSIMRKKILAYRQKLEEQRLQEEEKKRKEAEKVAKKTGVSADEILASNPTEELSKTTGEGTTKKVWTFELVDITKVPAEFLEVNSVSVREKIRAGTREIPGLKIFQKDTFSL